MGKQTSARRLGENQSMAVATRLRTSSQKLNLVAEMIRGLDASDALSALSFSRRRIASDVREVLQSAIANAENNHDLDVDRLYVSEASVGKSITMKRWRARARGRTARIHKPFSKITVIVTERKQRRGKKR